MPTRTSAKPPKPDLTVAIGDMALTDNPERVIVTANLGSCLGLVVHDPVACVGGILHAVMPEARIGEIEAIENPWRFVDMAVPLFLATAHRMGARREHSRVMLFGCASVSENLAGFSIGERNLQVARAWLGHRGIQYSARYTGGSKGRTVILDVATGDVWLKKAGKPAVCV